MWQNNSLSNPCNNAERSMKPVTESIRCRNNIHSKHIKSKTIKDSDKFSVVCHSMMSQPAHQIKK